MDAPQGTALTRRAGMMAAGLAIAGALAATPAPVPVVPVTPQADASGFLVLPMKGLRAVELTVEEKARIEVRVRRDAEGRFVARRRPPEATGPTAGEPVKFDFSKEKGTLYIDNVALEGPPPETPVSIVIEVPLRAALRIDGGNADVTITGPDRLPIPEALPAPPPQGAAPATVTNSIGGPADGPNPRTGVSVGGTVTGPAPAAPGTPGSGASATAPPQPAGAAIEVELSGSGTFRATDLTGALTVTQAGGDISVTRLAGRTLIKAGTGSVHASSIQTPLAIEGAGDVDVSTLFAGLDIRRASGRVRLRAIGGDARLTIEQGDLEAEEIRGRLEARLTRTVALIRDVTGASMVNGEEADLTLERPTGPSQVRATGGSVRIRDARGTLDVSGDADSIEIAGTAATTTVNSNGRRVRVSETRGPLTIQAAEGDIEVDQAMNAVNLVAPKGRATLSGSPRIARVTGYEVEATLTNAIEAAAEHYYTGKRLVTVDLPGGKYDIKVRAGGEIESDFPFENQSRPQIPGRPARDATAAPPPPPAGAPEGIGVFNSTPQQMPLPPKPGAVQAGRQGARLTIVCDGDVEINEG